MSTLDRAAAAPRGLLYLASFSRAERAIIAGAPELRKAIRGSEPSSWPALLERHQANQRADRCANVVRPSVDPTGPEHERQLRYVRTILSRELPALACMQPGSGRNHATFRLVCRVGRWAHAGIIERDQLVADVLDACECNGLVAEDGRKAVLDTIASGLARSAADALPELGART